MKNNLRQRIITLQSKLSDCCNLITSFLEVLDSVQQDTTISNHRREKYIKILTNAISYQESKLDEFKIQANKLHSEIDKIEYEVSQLQNDFRIHREMLLDLNTNITSLLLSLDTHNEI